MFADLEPTEIAEVLWLAHLLRREVPAPSVLDVGDHTGIEPKAPQSRDIAPPDLDPDRTWPPQEEQSPRASLSVARPGAPVGSDMVLRTPTARALPNALRLSRALRPLRRLSRQGREVLVDEQATAYRSAQTGVLTVATRFAPARWFDLALVYDDSASMVIWQDAGDDLQRLLLQQGAFRDVRRWWLDGTDAATVRASRSGAGRSSHELIDSTYRRLVLLFSDCVGPAWQSGAVLPMLEGWAQSGPVVIVQPLPRGLWDRCAVRFEVVDLTATAPGRPNALLRADVRRDGVRATPVLPSDGVVVPVIDLAERSVARWASMVAGATAGTSRNSGLLTKAAGRHPVSVAAAQPLSAEQRIAVFRGSASMNALHLAKSLSVASLTLPVMRLIQAVALPHADHHVLAEVFLGGLLEQVTPAGSASRPDDIVYEFFPGVRSHLLSGISRTEALTLLDAVSRFVAARQGGAFDFPALLNGDQPGVDPSGRPFAHLPVEVLRSLGGQYADLADELSTGGPASAPEAARDTEPAGGTDGAGSRVVLADPERPDWQSFAVRPPVPEMFGGLRARVGQLRQALEEHGSYRLTGPAGSGKTALASAFLAEYDAEYDVTCWIPADRPERIRVGLAALGRRLGVVTGETLATPRAAAATVAALGDGQTAERWLLVFDGAPADLDLTAYLPAGFGHAVITTRGPTAELTMPWDPGNAAALAKRLQPGLSGTASLGGDPAALTRLAALHALQERDPGTVDPAELTPMLIRALRERRDDAAQLMLACVFAGPAPVWLRLLDDAALMDLGRWGLIRIRDDAVWFDEGLAAAMLTTATPEQAADARGAVIRRLGEVEPGDPADPTHWAAYACLLPAVRACLPGPSVDPILARAVEQQAACLIAAGEPGVARALRTAVGDGRA